MTNNKNIMLKIVSLCLAFIGIAAMVFAWFVLLTTASHDTKIVAIEVGGVVITIAGYFLWQHGRGSIVSPNKTDELIASNDN